MKRRGHVTPQALATIGVLIMLLALAAWVVVTEPLLPDAADCAARGKPSDCWRETAHGQE